MLPLFVLLVVASSATALKKYSGIRTRPDSQQLVLYCDQTVAIVEYGKGRILYSCELIEVKTKEEKKTTLGDLSQVIPKKPIRIKFDQMIDLMKRCSQLPEPNVSSNANRAVSSPVETARTISSFAIFPGTKWCGSGDIAESYFDLGPQVNVDKCCRTHDICPVKVLGRSSGFGIKNDRLFTVSHCECDKEFYSCLKSTNNSIANSMGAVYFNLIGGSCMYSQNNRYLFGKNPQYK